MSNEPKLAPQAPAPESANQSDKSATETTPAAPVTAAPAVAPVETKKV